MITKHFVFDKSFGYLYNKKAYVKNQFSNLFLGL